MKVLYILISILAGVVTLVCLNLINSQNKAKASIDICFSPNSYIQIIPTTELGKTAPELPYITSYSHIGSAISYIPSYIPRFLPQEYKIKLDQCKSLINSNKISIIDNRISHISFSNEVRGFYMDVKNTWNGKIPPEYILSKDAYASKNRSARHAVFESYLYKQDETNWLKKLVKTYSRQPDASYATAKKMEICLQTTNNCNGGIWETLNELAAVKESHKRTRSYNSIFSDNRIIVYPGKYAYKPIIKNDSCQYREFVIKTGKKISYPLNLSGSSLSLGGGTNIWTGRAFNSIHLMYTNFGGYRDSVKIHYNDGSINNVMWKVAKCTDQNIKKAYEKSGVNEELEKLVTKSDIVDSPTPNKVKARLLIALVDHRLSNEVVVIERELNQWNANFKSKLDAFKEGGAKKLREIQAESDAARTRYRSSSPNYSSGSGTLYTCTVTCKDRSIPGSVIEIPRTIYGDFDVSVSVRATDKYAAKEKVLPNRGKICKNARGSEHFLGSPVKCR